MGRKLANNRFCNSEWRIWRRLNCYKINKMLHFSNFLCELLRPKGKLNQVKRESSCQLEPRWTKNKSKTFKDSQINFSIKKILVTKLAWQYFLILISFSKLRLKNSCSAEQMFYLILIVSNHRNCRFGRVLKL